MSRARNYVFTFNNYPDTTLVDNVPCKFIAYSKEVAPTTGTPHLQGYICFNSPKTLSAARLALPGCHLAAMRGSLAQNESYCSKSADLIKRGTAPVSNQEKGALEKERWNIARECAKTGNFDDIDADIYVRCYGTLKNIFKDHQLKPPAQDVKCYWIYGETGTGKSHCVETAYPDCYKKSMDDMKWFDGFDDQECVYLEDLDIYQVKWGGMLKRLADRWPMQASIKGSMKYIRPKVVIVTSNYHPSMIWSDPNTLEPLLRRFTVIEKLTQLQTIEF